MTRELAVLLGGRVAGRLIQGEGGALILTYDSAYREAADAIPVSRK
ncbi:hypothetical protein BJ973_006786 [Actinoplanes tereljensis]|uniref:Uncharacterized protein n=1 Tax=Paractinoplanes tereljensis TaxID=571912 RepID=A0A919TR10_9ACTN|nr:hypothetical protein Ate02nite_24730 [Actinoplanes tereljensis]